MCKLKSVIDKVEHTGYVTLPEPIEIKTHFPFAIFTFTGCWSNGFMLTLTNDDGEWWHIEAEEDEEIVDILYKQLCEPQTATA